MAPLHPQSIGEHLKRRRLDLHLMQADVAARFGVHVESVRNWERGVGSPALEQIPKIVDFLGYDPEPEPTSLPKRITHLRRCLGLTQEALAKTLGLNPSTVYRWERGLNSLPLAMIRRLEKLPKTLARPTPQ